MSAILPNMPVVAAPPRHPGGPDRRIPMTQQRHILVVDDEREVRDGVADYLRRHGLDVATAADGEGMRLRLAERRADLIVLDLRMPGEDGLSLARWLRARSALPIIILTATAEAIDKVIGLELGADDYLAKPFDPRELLARIKTVLRRLGPRDSTTDGIGPAPLLRFGRCELDLRAGRLIDSAGVEAEITANELELLRAFVRHPNQILSRDRLTRIVFDRDRDPRDRSLDVRILRIRRRVEPDPRQPRVIRTIRGAGYRYDPDAVS